MEDGSETHQLEDFLLVHCNHVSKTGEACNSTLEEAWVTGCSHVFCCEHAKEWFQSHEDCPICRDGRVKLMRMDLSRVAAKRRGRMLLLGMTPQEILQATETALNFWVDQKSCEFLQRKNNCEALIQREKTIEESLKDKLSEVETSCKELETEQRQLQQKIDETEKESIKVKEQAQRLKREFLEVDDQHNSLQRRLADAKRHEFFRRPLMETPPAGCTPQTGRITPLRTSPVLCPTPRSLHGEFRNPPSRQIGDQSILRNSARQQGASESSRILHGGLGPPLSNRKLPTFTPGFLGAGRITKRKIT